MSADVNKVWLVGNLTQDVMVRGEKQNVAAFSVVTNEQSKDGEDYPSYHNCVAFGKTVEKVAHLGKGSRVRLEGKIQYGKYTNKDGIEVNKAEVVVWGIQALQEKPQGSAAKPRQARYAQDDVSLENVPF